MGEVVTLHNGENDILMLDNTIIGFSNATDNTPTVVLSGALFVSGGGIWYKGFAGTYTELATA